MFTKFLEISILFLSLLSNQRYCASRNGSRLINMCKILCKDVWWIEVIKPRFYQMDFIKFKYFLLLKRHSCYIFINCVLMAPLPDNGRMFDYIFKPIGISTNPYICLLNSQSEIFLNVDYPIKACYPFCYEVMNLFHVS